MERREAILIELFSRLRETLREEPGVGLALRAEGPALSLRIRSEADDDERHPFFAAVVEPGEREGSFRVSYKPSGSPSAEREVTILDAAASDDLLGLVCSYLDDERRRLADFRQED